MRMKFEVANTGDMLQCPTVNEIRDGAKSDLERAYEKIRALIDVIYPFGNNVNQHDVSVYAQLCVSLRTVEDAIENLPSLSMSNVCKNTNTNQNPKPLTAPF